MLTDTLGRRIRTKRQPLGTRHQLTQRDISWLSFMHRHGGRLTTSYLHHLTSKDHATPLTTQRRLKILFQEFGLLSRPWQQNETLDPRWNEVVHELSPKGVDLLKEQGLYSDLAPSPHGAFKHQVMLSCISASFELHTPGFIPQHTVLERAGRDHRMTVDGETVTPDEVFAIERDGKQLLVFLEVDRGTEVTETFNFNRKSWTRSVRQYRKIIGHKLYQEHFKVGGGALLLVVTVSQAKQDGILKVISQEYPQGCNYLLTHYIPEFGRAFHPPRVIDTSRIEWKRYQHPPFVL